MKRLDLAGKRFGRLIVLKETFNRSSNGCVVWLCQCDCGNKKEIASGKLLRKIENIPTRSCGCIRIENIKKLGLLQTHGMHKTRQYRIWAHIKDRCTNPNYSQFKDYGGRGISYDPRWEFFEGFWEDMKEGYSDKLSIDRKDNNGNYCKDNCKWSTRFEQMGNIRNNRIITFNGKTQIVSEWSRELNIPTNVLSYRLGKGEWSIEKALTTPVNKKYDIIKNTNN